MQVLKKLSTASAEAAVIRRETGRYFHTRKGAMQKVGLLAVGTLLTSALSTPALGLTLDGAADFRNQSGAAGSVGTASPTSGLNTDGSNNTASDTNFEGFFTSDFGRLGTGVDSTQSSFTTGTFSRVSTPFQFTTNATQTVNFQYAFDGTDSSNNSFSAYLALANSPETAITGARFSTTNLINPGGGNGSFSITNPSLTSQYVVTFELVETAPLLGSDDVGAGFDNVNVSNAVPFEFSPSMGILALGAWGAFSQLKGKLKSRKPLNIGSLTTNDGQA